MKPFVMFISGLAFKGYISEDASISSISVSRLTSAYRINKIIEIGTKKIVQKKSQELEPWYLI
jgi:hypothetical protein